jgi:hypothetical protein
MRLLPRTLMVEPPGRRPTPKDLVEIFFLPRVKLILDRREVLERLEWDGEDLGIVGVFG